MLLVKIFLNFKNGKKAMSKLFLKPLINQLLFSCCGGQRPVDGLRQQPCSHHPTARVGHSIEFHRHIDIIGGKKDNSTSHTYVDNSVQNDEQASQIRDDLHQQGRL